MLVAAAVAFAVAAVSVTCWFIVQGKLYDQVDNDLRKMSQPQRYNQVEDLLASCPQAAQSDQTDEPDISDLRARNTYIQLVKADGTACVSATSAGTVKVTDADKKVIKEASSSGEGIIRNGTDSDGNAVRVLTTPLIVSQGMGSPPQLYPDTALLIAAPLKSTESTLNDLALVLLLVSGIGVVGSRRRRSGGRTCRAAARRQADRGRRARGPYRGSERTDPGGGGVRRRDRPPLPFLQLDDRLARQLP